MKKNASVKSSRTKKPTSKKKLVIDVTPKEVIEKPVVAIQQINPDKEYSLKSLSKPKEVLEVGQILKSYIIDNNLSVKIQEKDYAYVDAWKFAGMIFGLTAIPKEPIRISNPGEQIYIIWAKREIKRQNRSWEEEFVIYQSTIPPTKEERERLAGSYKISKELTKEYFNYKCETEIIRLSDRAVVSAGFTTCSNLELKKVTFDQYSVCSMSQTRSIGKAYRNLLGYVMNAAKLESTPAEEMEEQKRDSQSAPQPTKDKLTPEQFERTLESLKSGSLQVETVYEYYDLTSEQEHEVNKVLNTKK